MNWDTQRVKKALEELREHAIVMMSSGKRKIMENEGRSIVGSGQEIGDCSALHVNSYINICCLDACRDVLAQVENAQKRLLNGTYGICNLCNSLIDVKRLNLIPFATHCFDCQQDLEELRLRDHF